MAAILIAGCGKLGCELGLELDRRGHEVWGLRRTIGQLPSRLRGIAADLGEAGGIDALPREFDFVFYTAAASTGDDDGYRRAYVDGPRNLLAALAGQTRAPRRLLFTSSTAVYHQQGGEWVDEDSPTAPTSFRGARMLEGEAVIRSAAFPSCVVRLGGIYGPGRTYLFDAVRQGRATMPPPEPVLYTNRIHERDCTGLLAYLMELPAPAPVWLGVDSDPAPRAEVIAWLATRLGVNLATTDATATARTWGGNKRCRNARLLAAGYRLRYPSYREGYGELLG